MFGKVEHGPGGWGRRKKGGTHRTFAEIRRKEAAFGKRAGQSAEGVAHAPARAAPTKPADKKAAPKKGKKGAPKALCAASPSKLSARQLQEKTLREVSLLVCASACTQIGSACPIVSLTPKLCLVGRSARVGSGTSCERSRKVIAAFAASLRAATRILGCVASRATSTSAAQSASRSTYSAAQRLCRQRSLSNSMKCLLSSRRRQQ